MTYRYNQIDTAYLRQLLTYDPETGIMRWKVDTKNGAIKAGTIAGTLKTKTSRMYQQIKIDGKSYTAARLAWQLYYGTPPDGEIDHVDSGKPRDNSISNLRLADRSKQGANQRRQKGKKYPKGVSYKPLQRGNNKFEARWKQKHLGWFATADEAHAAYCEAIKAEMGDFARFD